MSAQAEPISHEQQVEEYLKDISEQTRYAVAILKDAFNSEIELTDVPKLEDGEDGD